MITAVAILGPTASGKSRLAMSLALKTGGEIVSIDSRQAYRHLDIGTAKPSLEDRRAVPHHLVDILELREKNNAERFARMAHEAVREVASRGKLSILVGGSGLYFRAITDGFFNIELDPADRAAFEESLRAASNDDLHLRLKDVDPESARLIHRNDRYRLVRALEVHALTGTSLGEHVRRHCPDPSIKEVSFVKIGLNLPRAVLHRRIGERVRFFFERGWVKETESLLAGGADPEWPGMKTLGYPQVIGLIKGKSTFDATIMKIVELTRQYAKRQITWFRKEPDVTWLSAEGPDPTGCVVDLLRRSTRGASG